MCAKVALWFYNGLAEKSVDLIRSLANVYLDAARHRFQTSISVNHPLFAWAFVHAGGLDLHEVQGERGADIVRAHDRMPLSRQAGSICRTGLFICQDRQLPKR